MLNPNLTTFLAVADCGSFNRASERLYISPPSVMKQINALEKHLELTLFTRTSQGIQLTAAGQVLYRRTKELAGFAAGALEEARRASVQAENTHCIGSSILNPCKPFMDLWYQVSQAFPGYKLHIVPFEDNHQGILAEIASLGKKFDFLVGVCDSKLWLDRCNFYQLGTGHYRAPDGTVKHIGGHSTYVSDTLWRDTPYETPIPEGYFVEEYTIEHCYWDVISMGLHVSRRTAFDDPVTLALQ